MSVTIAFPVIIPIETPCSDRNSIILSGSQSLWPMYVGSVVVGIICVSVNSNVIAVHTRTIVSLLPGDVQVLWVEVTGVSIDGTGW